MTTEQRAATMEYGRTLSVYGQLLAGDTSYIRSQVVEMRVLQMSLPNQRSSRRFTQARYLNLGAGLNEPRLERLVELGGGAERFGNSLARVADLTSSSAEEKIFSSTTHNLVLVASSVAEGLASVSIAAPAVNLVTFVSTDAYRRRLITKTLEQSEPTVRAALIQLEDEFNPNDKGSLLGVYSQTTAELDDLLESSSDSAATANLDANNRNLVATAYRVVLRNRNHIEYVTSRQRDLARDIVSAYDALFATFSRREASLTEIDRCSDAVLHTDLAFKSLQ